ncbi:MAG: redoxin domain-containing protein [Planctomycetales bacterium]
MRKLFLVVPLSAVVVGGLVGYRLANPRTASPEFVVSVSGRPAPLFQLYDEQSQIVRLARYIGRHKLLIVFFDGSRGPDESALLVNLRQAFLPIRKTKAIVLAISSLRPSQLRPPPGERGERTSRAEPFPFTLLADTLDNPDQPDHAVHRLYGAFDENNRAPREAVFVVDGAGIIRHAHLGPAELGTPAQWARELARVR